MTYFSSCLYSFLNPSISFFIELIVSEARLISLKRALSSTSYLTFSSYCSAYCSLVLAISSFIFPVSSINYPLIKQIQSYILQLLLPNLHRRIMLPIPLPHLINLHRLISNRLLLLLYLLLQLRQILLHLRMRIHQHIRILPTKSLTTPSLTPASSAHPLSSSALHVSHSSPQTTSHSPSSTHLSSHITPSTSYSHSLSLLPSSHSSPTNLLSLYSVSLLSAHISSLSLFLHPLSLPTYPFFLFRLLRAQIRAFGSEIRYCQLRFGSRRGERGEGGTFWRTWLSSSRISWLASWAALAWSNLVRSLRISWG
jgi:hypothetical protein